MSLESLTSTHTITIHPITVTRDALNAYTETLGAATATVSCRKVVLSREAILEYEAAGLTVTHAFYFNSNPSLDSTQAIAHGGEVYRYVDSKNPHLLDVFWRVLVNRDDTMEIGGP